MSVSLLVHWADLSDLGGGGGADGLGGDGLGTQQHPWFPLCQVVHRLWNRHLLSVKRQSSIIVLKRKWVVAPFLESNNVTVHHSP